MPVTNPDDLQQISNELSEVDADLPQPENDCPYGECNGSGVILPDPIGSGPAKDCKCVKPDEDEIKRQKAERRRKIVQRRFENAEVPKRFEGKGFDDFDESDNPDAYEMCYRYAEHWPNQLDTGNGLFLHGPSSTGKSHLAYSIGKKVIRDKNAQVLIMPTNRMIRELKPNNPQDEREEREQTLFSVDLLILDDIGRSRTTDWVTEKLLDVVDERYLEMKPTVFTSNYSLDELAAFESDSPGWVPMTERIREMTAKSIEMNGQSHRTEGES